MIGRLGLKAATAACGMSAGLVLAITACDDPPTPEVAATPQAAVVIWTSEASFPLAPLLGAYTKESGLPIEIVSDTPSPPARADLVLTSDLGQLWTLSQESGLRPTYSDAVESNVPAALRDPDSMWFGLAWRPHAVVYDSDAVDGADAVDYAALAEERWHARACLSSSSLATNRLLLASLIAQLGEPAAERIVRGWVANLAASPFASGDELLAAIAADRCDIGIVDTGALAGQPRDRRTLAVAGADGAFAIVAAAGVTRHATNPDGAAALLEWLSAASAQSMMTAESVLLPANPAVAAGAPMAAVGPLQPAAVPAAQAAAWLAAAERLAERAGYR